MTTTGKLSLCCEFYYSKIRVHFKHNFTFHTSDIAQQDAEMKDFVQDIHYQMALLFTYNVLCLSVKVRKLHVSPLLGNWTI